MLIVMIGRVFFRADTIECALQFVGRMFNLYPASQISFTIGWYLDGYILFILCVATIISLGIVKKFKNNIRNKVEARIILLGKTVVLFALLLISMIYVITSTYNPFIYFRF